MKRMLTFAPLLAATVLFALAANRPDDESAAKSATRVFELRTYTTDEGKLDDLHTRFRDHTCRLFKKHGFDLIGFWTPLDEKDHKGNTLTYMIAFPSREAAKKSWEEFGADPEWQKVFKESQKDGKIVIHVESVYLEPTDYSPIK